MLKNCGRSLLMVAAIFSIKLLHMFIGARMRCEKIKASALKAKKNWISDLARLVNTVHMELCMSFVLFVFTDSTDTIYESLPAIAVLVYLWCVL